MITYDYFLSSSSQFGAFLCASQWFMGVGQKTSGTLWFVQTKHKNMLSPTPRAPGFHRSAASP